MGRVSAQEKFEKAKVFVVSLSEHELPRSNTPIAVAYGQPGLRRERNVYFGR